MKTPKKFPSKTMTELQTPPLYHCLCVRDCTTCPSTQGATESAQGREVMRPLPPSRKGEGRSQEAVSPTSQVSCQLQWSGQLFQPFQHSQALSPRWEKTQYSISPKIFPARGLASASYQTELTICDSQRPGSGWGLRKGRRQAEQSLPRPSSFA